MTAFAQRLAEMQRNCELFYKPGDRRLSDAFDVVSTADGQQIYFTGVIAETLAGSLSTYICKLVEPNAFESLTDGGSEHSPQLSQDDRRIAFVSSLPDAYDALSIFDCRRGIVTSSAAVSGKIEYIRWSPDDTCLLLGIANVGAHRSGAQGGDAIRSKVDDRASWSPEVESTDAQSRWRSLWLHDVEHDQRVKLPVDGCNIWEADWCGISAVAAVASTSCEEGAWYGAKLVLIDTHVPSCRLIYEPRDQIGGITASPSGTSIAFIEGLSSDRGIIAGVLKIVTLACGDVREISTGEVDVSHIEWSSDERLLVAGHRGLESVVGTIGLEHESFQEVWSSAEISTGGPHLKVAGFGLPGDFVMIGETFTRGPEIARVTNGQYRQLLVCNPRYQEQAACISETRQLRWKASDALEIEGWLLVPFAGTAPYPLLTLIHGGPVALHHPRCLMRGSMAVLALLQSGFAIFMPNPRGSSGRGQAFAKLALNGMGGLEAEDLLSGIDLLIDENVADPKRLSVMGTSHGGYMATWLIGNDNRFAAAVAISPITNFLTEYLTSNLPEFVRLFLGRDPSDCIADYIERSSISRVGKVRTPVLLICGARDRCTPSTEALQFYNALLRQGGSTTLVTYPQEGHGIRSFPATIDHSARIVDWLLRNLPADPMLTAQAHNFCAEPASGSSK
jgi:dipeptidyl aminopeptidase/acylaminoacyl peptidase